MPIRRLLPNGAEPVLSLDKANGEFGQAWPAFLPPRKRYGLFREPQRFLYLSIFRDPARAVVRLTLCAATLGSKEVKRIGEVPSRVQYAVGHLFFVREGTLMAQPFDADRLELAGEAVPVVSDVFFDSRSGSAGFSVSDGGTIVCQRTTSAMVLAWVDAAGKKIATLSNSFAFGGAIFGSTRLGVAKDRVVLPITDRRAGLESLWAQGLDRQTSTRVTFSPAEESNPALSPDGSRVFFASDAESAPHIYEAPIDGSAPPKLVVAAPNLQVPNDVSPDGRFLLYTSNQSQTTNKQDLWIVPLTGERKPVPFLATPETEHDAVFSPDGKWIAYSTDATGTSQIYLRPFPGPGAGRPVSIDGGTLPRFSPDGKRIYFRRVGSLGKLMAADFHDGAVSEPKVLFEVADSIAAYEPVGDRFLMVLFSTMDASPPARVIVNWRPPA